MCCGSFGEFLLDKIVYVKEGNIIFKMWTIIIMMMIIIIIITTPLARWRSKVLDPWWLMQ